jgi:hypothetical protein
MSLRNVIALLAHVGRSELLPRWQSEEVDDELLVDIDLENFQSLGLTVQQARAAVAFKQVGCVNQSTDTSNSKFAKVWRLLCHVGREDLLSGAAARSITQI